MLGGLLLTIYVIVAMHVGLLDGLRVDRWAAIKRLTGKLDTQSQS